jgi:hypothetical protein
MSDVFERLLFAIRDRADLLDSGVFAPPAVAAMSDAEYEAAWAEVWADHNLVMDHSPNELGDSCGKDAQLYPCPTVQHVLSRYRFPKD